MRFLNCSCRHTSGRSDFYEIKLKHHHFSKTSILIVGFRTAVRLNTIMGFGHIPKIDVIAIYIIGKHDTV